MVYRFERGEEVAGGGLDKDVPCRLNPPSSLASLFLSSLLLFPSNFSASLDFTRGSEATACFCCLFLLFSYLLPLLQLCFLVCLTIALPPSLWPWAGGGKATVALWACRVWLCLRIYIFQALAFVCDSPLYIWVCVCLFVWDSTMKAGWAKQKRVCDKGEVVSCWKDVQNCRKLCQYAENIKQTGNKTSPNKTQEMNSAWAPWCFVIWKVRVHLSARVSMSNNCEANTSPPAPMATSYTVALTTSLSAFICSNLIIWDWRFIHIESG